MHENTMAELYLAYKNFAIDKSNIEFHEVIGRGGFAHQVLSATVKLPSGEVCRAAAKKVRNVEVKEVSVMAELDHKNIIKFYGVLLEELDTYIIMELAENGNLRHYLDECRKENKSRLPSEIVLKWVHEGASGIQYLHDANHSHRDIKSLNYLLTKDLTIKLGDLGLAKDMDLTQDTGGMRGTCRWMAPEVIMDQRRSIKSDVFSFGTVVWEIFTTDVPFAHIKGDFQVMNAICKGERPPIPDDCPQFLRDLISSCWKIDYTERPNMTDICKELQQRIDQEQAISEGLSRQLEQTAIDKGEESMDTITEDQVGGAQGGAAAAASHIASDCPTIHAPRESEMIKTPQEMPMIKQLFARQGLSSQEYVSCDDSSNSNSVAMYKMIAVPRGTCLIINNVDFAQARENRHDMLHDRTGSEVDSKKLCELFTALKFSVICKTNMTSDKMAECFQEFGSQDHGAANAFICCILSHGKCGQLAGCDGEYISIESILDNFVAKKCPSLEKKPKIFFIQACQGDETQENVDAQMEKLSGIGTGLDQTTPKEPDFLISLATLPGNQSYRNTQLGSWYIQVLVEKIKKLHEKEDLMSILTDVNRKLSKESSKSLGKSYGQMSFPVTTLLKKVYFPLWEKTPSKKKPSADLTHATGELDFQGGNLSLPAIGVCLKVPEGALPKDISIVKMSLSLHEDLEDHPCIDPGHLMITPIICCGPEGVEFNSPVTLILPHSVPGFREFDFAQLDDVDGIHLWFKSGKAAWQKLSPKIPVGQEQPFWVKQVTSKTIELEVKHFCKFGLSAAQKQDMKILMFMQPRQIQPSTSAVYVTAYAVQESLAEVIIAKETQCQDSIRCAKDRILTLLPNEKDLSVTLKDVKPPERWQPPSKDKCIEYKFLQEGNERSQCEIRFEKFKDVEPATIYGEYDAKQPDNQDTLNGLYFDIGMFPSSDSKPQQKQMQVAVVSDKELNSLLQLIPKVNCAAENLTQLGHWRDLLHMPNVRDKLLPILTENMLRFFSHMHVDDRQQIQNAFKLKPQSEAAEAFLNKITRLGNDVWHRELIEALAHSGGLAVCHFLCQEYHDKYLNNNGNRTPTDEVVFLPPKPKRAKVEDSRVQTNHLSIWSKVITSELHTLQQNLSIENLQKTLQHHMPDFVAQNSQELQARKTSDGENRASRWFLEKLSKCGNPTWPKVLDQSLDGSPVHKAIQAKFWKIHALKEYSTCPCESSEKES